MCTKLSIHFFIQPCGNHCQVCLHVRQHYWGHYRIFWERWLLFTISRHRHSPRRFCQGGPHETVFSPLHLHIAVAALLEHLALSRPPTVRIDLYADDIGLRCAWPSRQLLPVCDHPGISWRALFTRLQATSHNACPVVLEWRTGLKGSSFSYSGLPIDNGVTWRTEIETTLPICCHQLCISWKFRSRSSVFPWSSCCISDASRLSIICSTCYSMCLLTFVSGSCLTLSVVCRPGFVLVCPRCL